VHLTAQSDLFYCDFLVCINCDVNTASEYDNMHTIVLLFSKVTFSAIIIMGIFWCTVLLFFFGGRVPIAAVIM